MILVASAIYILPIGGRVRLIYTGPYAKSRIRRRQQHDYVCRRSIDLRFIRHRRVDQPPRLTMNTITHKLGNMLSPSAAAPAEGDSSASSSSPLVDKKAHPQHLRSDRHIGISEGRSKTASSIELFGMLKALAAGGNDTEHAPGEVDSDEDEEGALVLPGEGDHPGVGSAAHMPRAESFATIRQGDDEVDKNELRRWVKESRMESSSEAQSSKFTGERVVRMR